MGPWAHGPMGPWAHGPVPMGGAQANILYFIFYILYFIFYILYFKLKLKLKVNFTYLMNGPLILLRVITVLNRNSIKFFDPLLVSRLGLR
jgi:hypothetical protein